MLGSKRKTTRYARGVRSPAGLGTSPDGTLYYTENQGEYVGTSKLFLFEPNKFYGHPSGLVDLPGMKPSSPEIAWDKVKQGKAKAIALFPHSRVANSPGSPAWAPKDGAFHSFNSHMFVGDQTLSQVFRVLPEDGGSAVIPFLASLPSGAMRLGFSPDGHLYVGQTGRGWRSHGGKQAALIRLKADPDPNKIDNQLVSITHKDHSYTFTFTSAIDMAPKPGSITIRSWEYFDSRKYGSKELKISNDQLQSTSLSPDRKRLTLTLVKNANSENEGRVFQFTSKNLPITHKGKFEAYYTK